MKSSTPPEQPLLRPAPNPVQASPPPGGRWQSSQLLGDQREVEIEHGQAIYRLRLTAVGKLILTK